MDDFNKDFPNLVADQLFYGRRRPKTRPQDDHHEATRRPSEAISSPGDRTRRVGNIVIEFHADESVSVYCAKCYEDITTILKLFEHDC